MKVLDVSRASDGTLTVTEREAATADVLSPLKATDDKAVAFARTAFWVGVGLLLGRAL